MGTADFDNSGWKITSSNQIATQEYFRITHVTPAEEVRTLESFERKHTQSNRKSFSNRAPCTDITLTHTRTHTNRSLPLDIFVSIYSQIPRNSCQTDGEITHVARF